MRRALLFAVLVVALPASAIDKTEIEVDLPWKAKPNQSYPLNIIWHIAEDERDPKLKKPTITLVADQNGHVTYDPPSITVEATKQAVLDSVTMDETPSGLTQVRLNSPDLPAPTSSAILNIDLGFRGRITWFEKESSLESLRITPASLQIVDATGHPLPLDASIIVVITASNARIRLQDEAEDGWRRIIRRTVPIGRSDIGTIDIKPDLFRSGQGVLHISAYINDDSQAIFDGIERFDITPPWWAQLLVAIFGGIMFAAYQLTQPLSDSHIRWRIFGPIIAGIVAGVLAWALADLNVLGIHADKSNLTGYFILGLLTAYAGIESVLRRLGKSKDNRDQPSDDEE